MNTQNYNLWTPRIQNIENDFKVGNKIEVTIVPLSTEMKITPCDIIEDKKLV